MRPRIFLFAILLMTLFAAPAWSASPSILFDQGHTQMFTIEKEGPLQLSGLAGQLRSDGWQVASTIHPLTTDLLAGYDALVISGAFRPFSRSEIAAIEQFLQRGGKMAVMLHIAPPLVPLLARLGVITANGVVREGDVSLILDGESLNFNVVDLEKHPLLRGLDHFSLYGGWPLLAEGEATHSLARSGASAFVDLNRDGSFNQGDARQAFSLLVSGEVGSGAYAVYADDAIFQNQFLTGENLTLAHNLSLWLMPNHRSGVTI
ncbi:MAG: DUF4350 domain-containing protein [Desulfuromonas sp.]|nr:MAG: DUF4350 domain-containing protein [Desulfuromonas sp.]